MLHISLLVINRLDKTESAFFIYLVYSLLPKDLTIQNLSYNHKEPAFAAMHGPHSLVRLGPGCAGRA